METKSKGAITFQAVYYKKQIKDVGNKVEKKFYKVELLYLLVGM